jgi:hypothetical protein
MPKIGPTGRHKPGGPANPQDRGGLYVAIKSLKARRQIAIDFGTAVTWLALTKDEALGMVAYLRMLVTRDFGNMPYDKSTLPIKVTANPPHGIVEWHLPQTATVLVANPELFLALAEVTEDVANTL